VLVSGFVFGGTPESAIKKAFTETEIWVSPQLLKDTPFELFAPGGCSSPAVFFPLVKNTNGKQKF
jgi:hypothetical protein